MAKPRFQWSTGLEEAMVGLFIALMVSLLVYSTPISQFGPDISQKILLGINAEGGALGTDPHATNPQPPANWVFVDLGGRFCGSEEGGNLCPPARIRTDRTALAGLLESVRSHHPRAIILDVLTEPAGGQEDAALLALLSQPGAPILLAWSPSREQVHSGPDDQVSLVYDPARFLCDPRACTFPNARYFPSLLRITDGKARWLSPDFRATSSQGDTSLVIPSISRATALVAMSPANAPWQLVDRAASGAPGIGRCGELVLTACTSEYRETQRVFSFAPVQAGANRTSASLWDSISFTHYVPDADPIPEAMPRALNDAIVIIGDSRESAGDRTWSAVGSTSGAELILNDVRQYIVASPHPAPGLFASVLHELPFLLIGFVIVFIANAIFPGRSHGSHSISGALRAFGHAFMVMLLSVVLTAMSFAAYLWLRGVHPGVPVDVVTPFVGMMLASFFEAMHRLTIIVQLTVRRAIGAMEKA